MGDRPVRRYAAFAYGLSAALVGLAMIVYAVGFLSNAIVPKSIDTGVTHSFGHPVLVNAILIGLFGIQHSLMARPRFTAAWTRIVPDPLERSTYVLFAGIALGILMWAWRPMPGHLWHVDGIPALAIWGVYLGGWVLMFAAVFMIDITDLLGVRHVWAYLHDRDPPPVAFQTPAAYRYVRHPIMTGFLVAFWATPSMTSGHLVFAAGMTAYILIGVTLEQRDLRDAFGAPYRHYLATVPMFIPRPGRSFGPDHEPAARGDAPSDTASPP